MSERAAGPVGEDLLGLSVAAVAFFGLVQGEGGVGEHGMVALGGEQLIPPGGGLGVEVFDLVRGLGT